MALFRSLMFVPGNNARFVEKSRKLDADIICLDLEDSVPAGQKDAARKMIRGALGSPFGSPVYVRTNPPGSADIEKDLEAVLAGGLCGLVIPKVDDAGEVGRIDEAARKAGRPVDIIASIESARGAVNAHSIASHGSVAALVFGVFDLLHDMGVEYGPGPGGAGYARSKIPVDARAAGIPAIDSVWQDTADQVGLARDCELGRSLGYSGKSIIHPSQLGPAHAAFAPTAEQVAWARQVCEAYLESSGKGRGATTVSGKMIDEVHYKQARRLLDAAG